MTKIQNTGVHTVLSSCILTGFLLHKLLPIVLVVHLCFLEYSATESGVPNLQQLLKHPQYAEAVQHSQRMRAHFSNQNSGRNTDGHQKPTPHSPPREAQLRTVTPVHQTTLNSRTVSYTRSRPPESYPWSSLYQQTTSNSRRPSAHYSDELRTDPTFKVSSPPRRIIKTSVGDFGASSGQAGHSKEFYKVLYGTQEGIKHLKGNYGPENLSQAKTNHGVVQELEDVKLANEHFLRMRSDGRCKVPRPEVVYVKDYFPDPAKEFLPRCTLLHRCGPQAGCCEAEGYQCTAKAMQEVSLNFYTLNLGMHTSEVGLENSVEKLLFVNHTECECVPVNDYPRTPDKDDVKGQEQQDSHRHHHENDDEQKNGIFSQSSKCRDCPDPFCKREFPDGRCTCDCFDRQKPCLRIKRGREPLHHVEKRCVEAGRCHIPDCEYGVYDVTSGRCPKRPDDFHKGVKNNNHQRSLQNPNHRWTFFERD